MVLSCSVHGGEFETSMFCYYFDLMVFVYSTLRILFVYSFLCSTIL